MRIILLSAAATFCVGTAEAARRHVDPRDQRIDALEHQVQTLTDIVNKMRKTRPAANLAPGSTPAQTGAAAQASQLTSAPPAFVSTPTPSLGPNLGGATIIAGKPSIQSGDGRFVANLHGVMQFDGAGYLQHASGPIATDLRRGGASADTAHARDLNNGTNFRRARIGIDGKIFGDFDYNLLFEFGGAGAEDAGHIQELWLQYSGLQPLRMRVGAFPPSVGLEDQGSTNGSLFLERPAISDISRGIAGGDFREGAMLVASRSRWYAAASLTTRTVGTINSTASGTAQTFDQSFGGIVRFAAIPLQGDDWLLHVGAHGSRVFSVADSGGPDVAGGSYVVQLRERPELRVDGTRLIDTGQIAAKHVTEAGLELAGQKGPVTLLGEYEAIRVDRLESSLSNPRFHGWYAEGGFMLTGERRKYNLGTFAFDAPSIDHPFDIHNGTWGAFELAARYSVVDFNYHPGLGGAVAPADGIRGGEQRIAAGGLNWYLNPAVRFMFEYQHVKIDRLSPNAATYLTPIGAQVGQSYDTIAARSQIAF